MTLCTGRPQPHPFITDNGKDCLQCPLPRRNPVHTTEDTLLTPTEAT